jgi:hypothetical protein
VTRARLGALLLPPLVTSLLLCSPASAAIDPGDPVAMLFRVPGVSFEELLATPEIASLARAGGAGLLMYQASLPARLGGVERTTPPKGPFQEFFVPPRAFGGVDGAAEEIARIVRASPQERLLVIVTSLETSVAMRSAKDELHPIVVAAGSPDELFPDSGTAGSLTSDSTQRSGVVIDGDIRPTVSEFIHRPLSEAEVGSPIEVIPGPPPFELHERYLAQRRMYVPIGTAGGIYLAIVGLAAIAALALGNRVPRSVRRILGWGCLSVAALATALLAAGHLLDLTYATVVPFVALVTVFGTLAFAPLERRDVLLIPAGIGIAILVYFAAEAILSWTAALTPFVGGSELDGGRFYGLPNAFIGLLIGASLWIAHRLRTVAGFGLLVGVALFAGLPYLGANLGGGVSLFAAAGLWLAIRERERLGLWKGIGLFVGVTVLGTAVILAAHAISPFETHVTRFEERAEGLAGVLEKIGDRLQVGFDLIARNPFALIPVLGLPIAIAAVLRPPTALRPSLQRSPAWRDAILVTLLAGVVAYLVNDSGPAAAGFAFGLGLGGLLGVSLLSEAGKMGEP